MLPPSSLYRTLRFLLDIRFMPFLLCSLWSSTWSRARIRANLIHSQTKCQQPG